jgi:hypothetical protein
MAGTFASTGEIAPREGMERHPTAIQQRERVAGTEATQRDVGVVAAPRDTVDRTSFSGMSVINGIEDNWSIGVAASRAASSSAVKMVTGSAFS